jgi:catechol 2,3-dioxygenase-like lactoylglutathione lyase family enzyme
MIKPVALVNGHYECRSLKQTVPILEELLALEVVSQGNGNMIMKHTNTDWSLALHENPGAPDKPHYHHYGVRVATDREVDNAYEYLQKRKTELGLKIIPPETRRIAHSVHFVEPGGNYWEIESYEGGAKKHGLSDEIAYPWRSALRDSRFPDRDYVPQCLSHGTTSCADLVRARGFYRSVLGLEVMHPFPDADPYYIKHPSTPWYIVCLTIPGQRRVPSGVQERFTLAVESNAAVVDAHRWLSENAASLEIAAPEPMDRDSKHVSFIFTDPDANCWEIVAASS